MKKFILPTLLTLFVLHSCQNDQKTNNKVEANPPQASIDSTTYEPETNLEYILVKDQILYPSIYRDVEVKDIEAVFKNGVWIELYKDNQGYAVDKAQYNIKHIEEEPCSGFPAQEIISKRNTLLYFNIPTIPNGRVDSIAFSNPIIAPGQPLTFNYESNSYKLEASGIKFFDEENRNKKDLNYTLKLFMNDEKEGKVLINQSDYNDTATELIFMGDLDKDGKVDFIFSSPRDYEEDRVLIILSGSMMIYEGSRQFDC